MGLESPKHECGVVGIYSPGYPVSKDLYYGLIALQNRGQEGSGQAVFDNSGCVHLRKGLGLVNSVFQQDDIDGLEGSIGVGHNRYGTTGASSQENTQPFVLNSNLGDFAFVHNGNIFNARELRDELKADGVNLVSTSDSEIIAQLIARYPGRTFVEKIKGVTPELKGAYSCLIATQNSLIAFKDPHGIWPLSVGRINGSGYVVASETNCIDRIGGRFVKDLEGGDIVIIDHEGIGEDSLERKQSSLCSFEFYYFSDPGSALLGRNVEEARFDMGRFMWAEHQFSADWVVSIPETARPFAEGYAYQSGIPVRSALIRNRWLGRTFIQPSQRLREAAAAMKQSVISGVVEGMTINLIDDSIVRGTTTGKVIKQLKDAGAKEVNMLIAAPPIISPCHYGVDTADGSELVAARMSFDEIRESIGADRLGYLSLESGLKAMSGRLSGKLCTSCFTGEYSMQVPEKHDKFILEGFNR